MSAEGQSPEQGTRIFISYAASSYLTTSPHGQTGSSLLNGEIRRFGYYLDARQLLDHLNKGGKRPKLLEVTIDPVGRVTDALAEFPVAPHEPPPLLQLALRVALPAKSRDAILGDALEAYNDTLHRSGRPWVANVDYVKEIVYSLFGAPWRRLERIIALWRRSE